MIPRETKGRCRAGPRTAVHPALIFSLLTCSLARAQDCDANASITVGDTVGDPGEVVEVELRGRSVCEVIGLGMAIGHDQSRVRFLSAEPAPFLTVYAGNSLFFLAEGHDDRGFMSMFWTFDLGFGATIPPRSIPANTVLTKLEYSILPGATGTVILRNEDLAYGFPRIPNNYLTEDRPISPRLFSGSITVGLSGTEFRRGDVNADGDQDLADAIFILSYLFVGGTRRPPCTKAADANDSGIVDLSDALHLLNYFFSGGVAPAFPFARCGPDPTPDALSCASFPSC